MLSTGIIAVLGFFFWIISTHLYPVEQVGIGTTLISVMTLISSFSILGLDSAIIRFLPTSEKNNKKINTSFSLVALMSILISVIYLIFQKVFSPKLLFVRENVIFSLLFVVFVVFSSLNTISENIFIAYRSAKYVLIKNIIFGVAKLILPFILIALGAYGIFMSVGIAVAIAFAFSLFFLILKYNYSFKPEINKDIVRRMTKFSLGNYVAGFIGGLPVMILPILITNLIGPEYSAYFYMDIMIANFLYIIPAATSQSLFAEGSYSESELKTHLKKAIKIIIIIIIPAIIVIVFFGKYILLAFGKDYSNEGFQFLQLLSLSGIFVSSNYIFETILRVKRRIIELIYVSLTKSILILGLSYLFLTRGLLGIGFAWIIGQGLVNLIYFGILAKQKFIQF